MISDIKSMPWIMTILSKDKRINQDQGNQGDQGDQGQQGQWDQAQDNQGDQGNQRDQGPTMMTLNSSNQNGISMSTAPAFAKKKPCGCGLNKKN